MCVIAICQIDIEMGLIDLNLEKVKDYIAQAADEGADLIVFPELTLTGYAFAHESDIEELVMSNWDERLNDLNKFCFNQATMAALGYIEQDNEGYFNTVGLLGLNREIAKYRKIHLPPLGIDQFLNRGNLGFPVFQTGFAQVGINICYDQQFPESARSLAVQGAQVIIVPTCETMAQHDISDFLSRTRAYENRVYYVWANRIGEENDSRYKGASRIIDPLGEIIALGGTDDEEIIYCDIDPSNADDKRSFDNLESSERNHDIFQDRSPKDYHHLV